MLYLDHLSLYSIFPLPAFFLLLFIYFKSTSTYSNSTPSKPNKLPKSYPLIGSYFTILKNRKRGIQWTSDILAASSNSTVVIIGPLGLRRFFTSNPLNVHHIIKARFDIYQKGDVFRMTFSDLFGDGTFVADGEKWRLQRLELAHQLNTKGFLKYVERVVDSEINDRLLPLLSTVAEKEIVLDFQEILQRFFFDNICQIALGHDPQCLLPSLPNSELANSFRSCTRYISKRYISFLTLIWRTKRLLNIGDEKKLNLAIKYVRDFIQGIIKEKKHKLGQDKITMGLSSNDLLSLHLNASQFDETMLTDRMIDFILAGNDTLSSALTWFFWLLSKNASIENEILAEINKKSIKVLTFDNTKDMVYMHAAISESMRIYPPIPWNPRQAMQDDIWPDGTKIRKGTMVTHHTYAMGRSDKLWGLDWAEFRPGRWLEKDEAAGKWNYKGRDAFTNPVFHAGPRICLGKEIGYLLMKRVVGGVLRRFRVVPAVEEGFEPVYIADVTSRMKGCFPVRIWERAAGDI